MYSIIELVEYELDLSTGERLKVSELDPDRISDGPTKEYVKSNPDALIKCTRMSRETIEHAKLGYDTPFKSSLKSPPQAMLLKFIGKTCFERKSCASYDSSACTSEGFKKKNGKFELMQCWVFDSQSVEEREVMTVVLRAWFEGRTVIIVNN